MTPRLSAPPPPPPPRQVVNKSSTTSSPTLATSPFRLPMLTCVPIPHPSSASHVSNLRLYMCVCIYVCMYVCMYVCVYGWMDAYTHAHTNTHPPTHPHTHTHILYVVYRGAVTLFLALSRTLSLALSRTAPPSPSSFCIVILSE
jgi:hypothetical protein